MARLIDTRRLTGPNLLLDGPGAGAELELGPDDDVDALIASIGAVVAREGKSVGITGPMIVRRAPGWLSLAVAAPVDALLTAADLLEVAAAAVLHVTLADEVRDLVHTRGRERDDALVALIDGAAARGTPLMWDDEVVTVGFGARSSTYARGALPLPSAVPWATLGAVPTAVITGTNGKTTTTRLLAAILRAAGHAVGATSTDGVEIDGAVVEAGDWSGPGGARRVLRDARVTAAALETARGGLLRRGLAITGYGAAVVTNVADDHLGEYGITDLDAMADVKCLVARGLSADGVLVVNGADPRLRARALTRRGRTALFAREPAGVSDDAWSKTTVVDGAITIDGRSLIAVADVPVCFGGAATFNVDNALAAAAAAHALGASDDAIAQGLLRVRPSLAETPGRANVIDVAGVTVVLDFAHNPAAVAALMTLVHHLASQQGRTGRFIVCMGAPGDRLDAELTALADAFADAAPAIVIVRELADYLRGRAPGAVPDLLSARLHARGIGDVRRAADDVSGLRDALAVANVGDVVVLTPLIDTEGVTALTAT